MKKKEYKEPSIRVVKLEHTSSILAGSQTPSGYSVNYKDEDGDEGVSTVQNTIWDR